MASSPPISATIAVMQLYNTASKRVEVFHSLREEQPQLFPDDNPKLVTMYACGPTVYDYTHIGHLRKYVMDDVLVRVLRHAGYEVKHVQNITDVGHLVSDDDEGEDKMEKGARKYGQTAWEVAKKFEDYFFYSMDLMGVTRPTLSCRATEHIQSQLALVQDLERKGLTYVIEGDGVYFDTAQLEQYGQLSGHDPRHSEQQARVTETGQAKRNPTDFALWKFERPGEDRQMVWPSPWHPRSFPGWHVECSAMSIEHLGAQLDIHTGGIDHIAVHHANEIAQSESYTGQEPFARFWVHHNFLRVDGEKMSKSLGNFYTIDQVLERGFQPAALRLLFLQSHYRSEQNFTWASLAAAATSLKRLQDSYLQYKAAPKEQLSDAQTELLEQLSADFFGQVQNDLRTPEALAVLWQVLKTKLPASAKLRLLTEFDLVLGLGLARLRQEEVVSAPATELSAEVEELFAQRQAARASQDWAAADRLRQQLLALGFQVNDTATGSTLERIDR